MSKKSNSTPTIVHLTATTHFPIKLTATNFPHGYGELAKVIEVLACCRDGIRGAEPYRSSFRSEKERVRRNEDYLDLKARNYLFYSIDKSIIKTIAQKATAKQVWDAMKMKYMGNARVKRAQLQRLRREFETLEMKNGETVNEYVGRVMSTANQMRNSGDEMPDVKIVEKVLRTLTPNFNFVVCSIEESKDLDLLTIDELQSSLRVHEQKLTKRDVDDHALKIDESSYGRGRGRSRGSFGRGRSRGRGRGRGSFDKSSIECYKCQQMGHYQFECPQWNKGVNYAEFDDTEELVLMAKEEKEDQETTECNGYWFLDSACSNHMTGTKEWFTELDENINHSVKLGNGLRLNVQGIGSIKFEVNGIIQIITKVYFVPQLTSNLISIGQLQEKKVKITIENGECTVYHAQRGVIMKSEMSRNRMFIVHGVKKGEHTRCMQVTEDETQVWHRRLAHVNYKAIKTMQQKEMVRGLPEVSGKAMICETCNVGKQNRENIPKKSWWRSTEKLELIHTDLCGPITPASQSGKRYVLVFIDDLTRKTWVYLLQFKHESFDAFKRFKVAVENESGCKIKALRSDRGGEFNSQSFNEFCAQSGIKRQLTAAYTPQQNGVAERRNRTIMNMVRCSLTDKKVPKCFWPEAVNWAVHVLNRCITRALDDKVPEEMWSGKKPNVEYFRVFGCIGHVHIPSQFRSKLDARSHKCVLLGMSVESKAYRLYDPEQRKIVISRDVIFEEDKGWEWNSVFKEEELIVEGEEVLRDNSIEERGNDVERSWEGTTSMGQESESGVGSEANSQGPHV
ncbi:hypothetical protein E3N88_36773 [Mikania micrantha]|uniref:Integrase catalytic domain-containing protein n=1 Tax=Mikania micrantha TaxID=192012 RepID=A0A5N6M7D6_9ASTR|nr:hypothetical protein E3N88_36773 [Mikania micrantha]